MIITYDIIRENLKRLEEAEKAFPNIIGEYKATKNKHISNIARNLGLYDYIRFIDWLDFVEKNNMKLIYEEVKFDELKKALSEKAQDKEFSEYIKNKNKKGFQTFLNTKFNLYNSGRNRAKSYGPNFTYTETLLINYIIINKIDFTYNEWSTQFARHYIVYLPPFEEKANREYEVTEMISNSIAEAINKFKDYDLRKLNFNLLKDKIESIIKQKVLSLEIGEKIRCLESSDGLTLNKVYSVESYGIGLKGNLFVNIRNDSGRHREYNYRIFENVSALRDSQLEMLLGED